MRAALSLAEGVTPAPAASSSKSIPPGEIATDGASESHETADGAHVPAEDSPVPHAGDPNRAYGSPSECHAAVSSQDADRALGTDQEDPDDGESPLFMRSSPRRSFETSNTVAVPRPGPQARRSAPPSTAALWANQLSHVAFPGRRSAAREGDGATATIHMRSASVPGRPALAPLLVDAPPATPPRSGTSRFDGSPALARTAPPPLRKRVFDSPTFRTALRLPFLPSIPASPLPIVSPGLTRSASSPPVIPAIPTTEPLNPDLCLTPPTASLSPSDRNWLPETAGDTRHPWQYTPVSRSSRPTASASAPNLSLYATIDQTDGLDTYFATPGTTAASTPGIAPAGLSFSPIERVPKPFVGDERDGLTHDEALLILDATFDPDSNTDCSESFPDASATNRYHALLELVETERGYLEHLRILVKVSHLLRPRPTLTLAPPVLLSPYKVVRLTSRLHDRFTFKLCRSLPFSRFKRSPLSPATLSVCLNYTRSSGVGSSRSKRSSRGSIRTETDTIPIELPQLGRLPRESPGSSSRRCVLCFLGVTVRFFAQTADPFRSFPGRRTRTVQPLLLPSQ